MYNLLSRCEEDREVRRSKGITSYRSQICALYNPKYSKLMMTATKKLQRTTCCDTAVDLFLAKNSTQQHDEWPSGFYFSYGTWQACPLDNEIFIPSSMKNYSIGLWQTYLFSLKFWQSCNKLWIRTNVYQYNRVTGSAANQSTIQSRSLIGRQPSKDANLHQGI